MVKYKSSDVEKMELTFMRVATVQTVKRFKRIEINTFLTILLMILFSLAITVVCFALQPNPMSEVISNILHVKMIFIYNFLPVLLAVILFYLITNNIFFGSTIVLVLFSVASLINNYKIAFRDDPFVPIDISLGGEALSIISKTNMKFDPRVFLLALLPVLLLIFFGLFIRNKKMHILDRVSCILLCIIAAVLLNSFIYKSETIYAKLPVKGSRFNVTENFNSKGFIYCFLYNLNTYSIEVPPNYSTKAAEKLSEKYALKDKKAPQKKPHVIMVMSEAFSDLSNNPNLIFASGDDPLKNFKEISKGGVSGHLIVPKFGGGTADTEYDVLTGGLTNNLSASETSAFRLVRKNFNALPRFFAGNGYQTLFIHPGESWFYNRANVYKYFGISDQIFEDKFSSPKDYIDTLVSDNAFADKIIAEYEKHISAGKDIPLFNFNVSIQNHMPYGKYKHGSVKTIPVKTKIPISAKASELLSSYLMGIRDADRALGKMTAFFKQRQEPVIFVFFGDHLPNLGENYLAYKDLGIGTGENGSIEEMMKMHQVPFLIWANDAAKNTVDFNHSVEKLGLPADGTISANYLGAVLYQLLGYQGNSPFYDFLNGLRERISVVTRNVYKTEQSYVEKLPEDLGEKVEDFRIWQYYRMTQEKVN